MEQYIFLYLPIIYKITLSIQPKTECNLYKLSRVFNGLNPYGIAMYYNTKCLDVV